MYRAALNADTSGLRFRHAGRPSTLTKVAPALVNSRHLGAPFPLVARHSCFTWLPKSTSVVTMTENDSQDRARLRVVPSWSAIGPVYTIKDVADACGLPQPVIAQVVPRTW